MRRPTPPVRALAAAGLVALALAAGGAAAGPGASDSRMSAPQRRSVFLMAPASGYKLPAAPLEFGATETSRCLECHGLPAFIARDSASGDILRLSVDSVAFHRSAHGALACTQCHADIHRFPHEFTGGRRAAVGCDADCHARDARGKPVRHEDQMAEFRASVHRGGLKGDPDQPTCAYCHGDGDPHAGRLVKDEFTRGHALELCASCHEDGDRMRHARGATDAVSSYRKGFHYPALRLGDTHAAICQDCHDTHGVRAARDTAATTHPSHLVATCGQKGCHRGVNARFAGSGTDHVAMLSRGGAAANRIGGLLAWAGGIVLALMAAAVLLDLQRPLRAAGAPTPGPLVPRLSAAMRLQHGLLVGSFTVLALTGLPLLYPDLRGMHLLDRAFGGWAGAREAHRVAAGVMLFVALIHLVIAVVRLVRARFDVRRAWPMLPDGTDAREAWETLLYQLRLRPAAPAHGRHEFRARVHYLAVLWGVPAMALTGLVLWFALPLAPHLPRSAMAIAMVAHGEEALLAVAIVLLWHFYNVHFAPGRGLRVGTLVDGRVTAQHQSAVHAGEGGSAPKP